MYEKDGGFLLICRHPNVVDQILIFPQLGKKDTDLATELLSVIPASDDRIRLARVKTSSALDNDEQLINKRSIKLDKCEEDILDWKYPVHILATSAVASLDGPQFKRLRNLTRQANDRAPQVTALDAVSHSRALENLLHRWASLNAKTREEYELLYAPYDNLFSQSMEKKSGLSGLMVYVDGTLQAVSLWDISNDKRKTANLFVDFCNVQIPGISEFLIVKSCNELKKQGIEFLNIGGSEGEGLDNFKRKFRPVISIDLCSVDAEVIENFHPAPVRGVNPSKRHEVVFRRIPNV